jgi:tryptophan-rich sensory protein
MVNILAFVLTVLINGLAGSTTILGGVNTAQVSDSNPTFITPAGYVFAIWGVIYILLFAYIIYQALPSQRGKDFQEKVGWFFALSCLFNIAWILVWQYGYVAFSVLPMLGLLGSLIMIYQRLNIGKVSVGRGQLLTVHLPFSVYLGWITVATIADISAALVSHGQSNLIIGAVNWSVLVIVVALLITGIVLWTRRDVAYAAVLVWALVRAHSFTERRGLHFLRDLIDE